MATSSIFQHVLVKDTPRIKRLVNALEQSEATPAKEVCYSRSVEVVEDAETIRKMFGVQSNDGLQDHHD